MNKKILSFIINSSILFSSLRAFAVVNDDTIAPLKDRFGAPVTDVGGLVGILLVATKWFYTIIFIIAIIMILMSAYNFITAEGDSEQIKKAKKQLIWAIVGIAIALLSAVIALVVKDFISGGGASPGGENILGGMPSSYNI